MDVHKETQAQDLVGDKKRKSTYATEVAAPDKKADLKLGDGQLSQVQYQDHSSIPNEFSFSAKVQELEEQVVIDSNLVARLGLTQHANS